MKRVVSILLMLALSFSLLAQKSSVTSAWSYLKDGFLDDAKKSIDKAAEHPKTQDWYKTHYFKGLIYQALGNSEEKKYKDLCGEECFNVAYDSYLHALKYNFVKAEHKQIDIETPEGFYKFVRVISEQNESNYESTETLFDIIQVRFPSLINAFYNKGIESLNNDDYKTSYSAFEKALKIAELSLSEDHQLMYVTSVVALKDGKYNEVIRLSDALIKAKYGVEDEKNPTEKVNPFYNKAMAYKLSGDTVKMLSTIEEGIALYPNDSYSLVIEGFNTYVSTGENDKAYDYIAMAIKDNPKDPQFYVIRGTLSETLKNKEQAEVDYKKALELDPENFDANYALGAFYYNNGVDAVAWGEENIPITDRTASDKHAEETMEIFKKSLPYLEKSNKAQPSNIEVMQTLKTIYYRLRDMDNYEKTDKRLKELVGE